MYKLYSLCDTVIGKKPEEFAQEISTGNKHVPKHTSYPVYQVIETWHDDSDDLFVRVEFGFESGIWWLKRSDWEVKNTKVPTEDTANWPFIESEQNPNPNLTKKPEKTPDRNASKQGRKFEVPTYFSQRDNYRDANRTCFSSASSMVLKWYRPDAIQSDDEYLKTVFSFGDTVEASVQLKTLKHYDLSCEFSQTKSIQWLKDFIYDGEDVVALGILNRGLINKPHGGGHYVLAYGYDEKNDSFLIHDPFAAYNWSDGTYDINSSGAEQVWPSVVLEKRWTVESKDSGWCLFFPK